MAVGAVVTGISPTVFTTLMEPHVRMAVWSRPARLKWTDPMHSRRRAKGRGSRLRGRRQTGCLTTFRAWGGILSAVSGSPNWRATFQRVTTRARPRFHQDAISVRLIATYQGPGSEWAFATELGDDLDAQRAETRRRVRTLQPGDIAIMKGTADGWEPWPDLPVVLHRSPAASRNAFRRVLTIDAVAPIEA